MAAQGNHRTQNRQAKTSPVYVPKIPEFTDAELRKLVKVLSRLNGRQK